MTGLLAGEGIAHRLHGRSFVKETDFSAEELLSLIDLADTLRAEKRSGSERQRMIGRNIALIFEKASTRTRAAFEVGAHDQGAHVTYLGPEGSHIGGSESIRDTARVLGRMFDGIEYRGFSQDSVEVLAAASGVPVWNGLTDQWHPTQMLADIMTIRDHTDTPLEQVRYCYIGDARNNTASSLLVTAALLGMDVRIASPEALSPPPAVLAIAEKLASDSGARIRVSPDIKACVDGADFLYTDVWVSMGEPVAAWRDRIALLLPFQVNAEVLASTGNSKVKFMHCLPALHNTETELGRRLSAQYQLDALEVTEEVFESAASIVFDQAENRLHTIKAVMVATLGD